VHGTTLWLITPSRRCWGVVPQELVFDPFFSEASSIQSGYFGKQRTMPGLTSTVNLGLADKANANMRQLSGT
jgi:ABC-2 type transport system ATP-binding protein